VLFVPGYSFNAPRARNGHCYNTGMQHPFALHLNQGCQDKVLAKTTLKRMNAYSLTRKR
jgi:hypothetical protein